MKLSGITIAKFVTAAFLLITISSCDTKSCTDVNCPAGQVCNNGNCFCPNGYEGGDCTTSSQDKFIGNYNVSQNCNPTPPFSTISYASIYTGNSVDQLQINQLLDCNYIIAYIQNDQSNRGNILYIPEQSTSCAGRTVSGQGTFDVLNNRISLQLYLSMQGTTYQCSVTMYKQ